MRQRAAFLFFLCLLLYLPGLWSRDFWAPDEPRYAQVAREMLQDGHWLLPHLNGQPYSDKPPLFFWAVAVVSAPLGDVHEGPARLVSALAALLTVLLTYAFGRRMLGEDEGFFGALILAASLKFLWQAQWLQIDMLLTLLETSALMMLWDAASDPPRAFPRRAEARKHKIFWAALFTAAALLCKGPVGLIPLGIAAVWTLFLRRDFGAFKRSGVLWCLLWSGLIAVAWLAAADRWGGEPYSALEAFSRHVVERVSEGLHHKRTWHYYLYNFPMGFFPWIFFFLASLFMRARLNERGRDSQSFLWTWFLFTLAVFSLSAEKRDLYILSLYPAAALLTARYFARAAGQDSRRVSIPALLTALVLLAAGGALFWPGLAQKISEELPVSPIPMAALCLAAGAAMLLSLRKPKRILGAAAAWSLAASLLFAFYYASAVNPLKSPRMFAEEAAPLLKPDTPLATYPAYWPTHFFYLDRKAELCRNERELADFFARHPQGLCVSSARKKEVLENIPGARVKLLRPVGGGWVALLETEGWGESVD